MPIFFFPHDGCFTAEPCSFLCVRADAERFVAKAPLRGADVLVLDLEVGVAADAKLRARAQLATSVPRLRAPGAPVFVRVNHDPELLFADLEATVAAGADGLIMPKVDTAEQLRNLDLDLAQLEARFDRTRGAVRAVMQHAASPDHFDWCSRHYVRHGTMMPPDWKDQIGSHDAIYFGAVGAPDIIADHTAVWESLIRIRREFDQYVNLRPARLMPGVPAPLANRRPGDIDFLIVRENTEGEYSSVGGRMFEGTDREFAIQESVFTRTGVDRILRYAFELARSRPRKSLRLWPREWLRGPPGFHRPEDHRGEARVNVKTLNVVGCGKVGQTLAQLFHASGSCIVQDLKGIDQAEAERAAGWIGAGRDVEALREMRSADLWLVTVPDTKIEAMAGEMADAVDRSSASIAFHCSGFLPASTLGPVRALGWKLASTHPVLTFADPAAAVAQFPGTPCGLEGDELALEVLRPLFASIGAHCFQVQTKRKALYHAAAVFSSKFTVVLQAIAREAWAAAGVPDDLSPRIQASLLKATVANVAELGPRAITGPAARGDDQVVRSQGADVFRWHPDAGVVYQELSRLARRLAVRQSTFPPEQGT